MAGLIEGSLGAHQSIADAAEIEGRASAGNGDVQSDLVKISCITVTLNSFNLRIRHGGVLLSPAEAVVVGVQHQALIELEPAKGVGRWVPGTG